MDLTNIILEKEHSVCPCRYPAIVFTSFFFGHPPNQGFLGYSTREDNLEEGNGILLTAFGATAFLDHPNVGRVQDGSTRPRAISESGVGVTVYKLCVHPVVPGG